MSHTEETVFAEALEKRDPQERAEFLDQVCGDDAVLRASVESLLSAYEDGQFLECPAAALAETVDETAAREGPGAVTGKYKLLEQIGEGAFGVVFMAEQQQPIRRKVALKILKPGMDTRQVIARFEAERQALALMDHPNMAKVLDAGQTTSGRPYFVMDLVRGLPITEFCDQAKLPIRDRLELFFSVCQAVQHAHQKGIIHRDIKPSNVLVTLHDGTPLAKVIDFGIAKALGQELTDKTLYTGFAQLIGTPLYMSPEQAAFSNVDVDTRSDIYSLGVLLYELLTGTTPFDRARLHQAGYDELRRIIREEEPPKPSTRVSTLGQAATTISTQRQSDPRRLGQFFRAELDWIVMKCLEKDRNRRYETANGLARDIQRYLNDEPVQACPPSAWYKFRKFARRRKTALAVAGLILLFVAVLGGGGGWAMRDRAAREDEMERERRRVESERLGREQALDDAVARTLDETGPLMDEGKWPEALAVVQRADKLLAAAGRTERPLRLLELRKDLSMAQRLEEIYLEPTRIGKANLNVSRGQAAEHTSQARRDSSEEEFFWGRAQDARFAREFQEFGIDVKGLGPGEAAARIRGTSVRPALVQALDEWAAMRQRAQGEGDAFWKKLLEIARQADPDDWRNQFREALLRRNRAALEKLATVVPIRTVPPATAYLLGQALGQLGAVDSGMAVLVEAHRHHPEDFWLNDALGYFSKDAFRPPRYDDALRYYMATVVLRPKNASTHLAVAELLEAKGVLDEAIGEWSKAIELEPNKAGLRLRRGVVYIAQGQWEKAASDYGAGSTLDPDNHWYWYQNAALCLQTGKVNEYRRVCREMLTRFGNTGNPEIAERTAKTCSLGPEALLAGHGLETMPQQEVLKLADRAVTGTERHGDYRWFVLAKGLAEYRAGHDAAAVDWINRFSPGAGGAHWDATAFAVMAMAKHRLGLSPGADALRLAAEARAALGHAQAILAQKQPDPKEGRPFGGDFHDWLHAQILVHEAEGLLPRDGAGAAFQRGAALSRRGKPGDAAAEYQETIRRRPDWTEAHYNLARAFAQLGQWDQAIAAYEKFFQLSPSDANTYNEVAWSFAVMPDLQVRHWNYAVQLAEKAVQLAPEQAFSRNTLGVAYYRAEHWKDAIEALTKSMELQKGNLESFDTFFLAMAHWRFDEKEKARQWYDRAVLWMEKNKDALERNKQWLEELRLFRAEAEELLGVKDEQQRHRGTKKEPER